MAQVIDAFLDAFLGRANLDTHQKAGLARANFAANPQAANLDTLQKLASPKPTQTGTDANLDTHQKAGLAQVNLADNCWGRGGRSSRVSPQSFLLCPQGYSPTWTYDRTGNRRQQSWLGTLQYTYAYEPIRHRIDAITCSAITTKTAPALVAQMACANLFGLMIYPSLSYAIPVHRRQTRLAK